MADEEKPQDITPREEMLDGPLSMGDMPTPEPDPDAALEPAPVPPPAPPTPEEIDDMIETAVGQFISRFRAEHPSAYNLLVSRLGHPLELEMRSLIRDGIYDKLVADTDEAVDLGQIVKAIAEIVIGLMGRFLPILGG